MEQYGILLPNGKLATLESSQYHELTSYYLSDDPRSPIWLTNDPEKACRVLFQDTPYYDCSEEKPAWGKLKGKELKVAKLVTTIVELEIQPPLLVPVIQTREIPASIAQTYAKVDLPKSTWYTCALTSNTVDELACYLGHDVCFNQYIYSRNKIIAIQSIDGYDGPSCDGAKSFMICEAKIKEFSC